jgi:hypothetical protein
MSLVSGAEFYQRGIWCWFPASCLSELHAGILPLPQEREPFISELLTNLTETIHDLQPHQVG